MVCEARPLDGGSKVSFSEAVPSNEVPCEQSPNNIFRDAAASGRRDNNPACLVTTTFNSFAEDNSGGALPAAVQRRQHSEPITNCLLTAAVVSHAYRLFRTDARDQFE